MAKMKGMKILGFIAAAGFAIAAGSCGLTNSDDKKGDPVPGPTGNLVATSAPVIAMNLMNLLVVPPAGAPAKPSASGVTALSTLRDKQCGDGGSVEYTEDGSNYTATMTNCTDANVTVNGTVTGTVGPTVACDDEELPTSMSADSGDDLTVDIDGQLFEFVNFNAEATNIVYGPDCDLDGGSFDTHLHGKIKTTLAGEDMSIDFGSDSLNVNVLSIVDPDPEATGDRTVTTTVEGEITIDTFCKKGKMTILTVQNLVSTDLDACPSSGQIQVDGDFGTATWDFGAQGCDLAACELSADDFNPFSE